MKLNIMIIRVLVTILLGIGAIFAYIKYLEIKGVYYPVKEINFYPSAAGLKFDDVYILTKDNVKINGWFIPSSNRRYTLLFCHGNAGNIQDRMDKIKILNAMGLDVFIIDYRGFGKSGGRPSENGFYRDALAAYDYLVNVGKVSPDEIILYGESLGSAVIIDLASKRRVRGLILEGAFSRGRDMAGVIYPFIPKFFFSHMYDSLSKIKKVNAAVLFIHSREDEIVPLSLARKLFTQANEPKYFTEYSGDHNYAFLNSQDKYISAMSDFINKI